MIISGKILNKCSLSEHECYQICYNVRMSADLFPGPPGDPEEPDGSGLPGDGELWEPGPDDDDAEEGPGRQGLYVCLPPEQLTLAGFTQNGEADTMTPGPVLATVVDAVTGPDGTGLAGCSDDQLMGIISAARRMESRNAWTSMAAMAQYAARHAGKRAADEFAPVELGYELHLNPTSAAEQMKFAVTVATRLPATFAALRAGLIHPVHLRIIADETTYLSDEDAAKADQMLAGAAPGMTFGELRYAAHKLILKLDPEAARKRKDAAKREAQVRRFREESGNAGMVARELPSDEVLVSWQHIEQRALDLRAAGMPGTLQELRVRAYLDLLQERDSRDLPAPAPAGTEPAHATPADGGPADAAHGDAGSAEEASGPDQPGPDQPGPDQPGPGQPPPDADPPASPAPGGSSDGGPSGPSGPSGPGGPGPAPRPGPGSGPVLAALVNITIPLATAQGWSDTPGEAAGFGIVDGDGARDLLAAAARHPRTRWCITAVGPDGTAAAHACLRGRHPPPAMTPPGTTTPGTTTPGTTTPGTTTPGTALPGTGPPPWLPVLTTPLIPIAKGTCDHTHAETGYHPSRKLQHLIRARSATCTAPGCTRPAAACDLDHTVPWDQGGLTCECGLAPLCRRHHRCKQAEGWHLEQTEPGILVWRVPCGRSYVTVPTEYAV
jgi:hypothetical protein